MSKRPNQAPTWEAYEYGRASESPSLGPSSPIDHASPSATSALRPIRSPGEQNIFGEDLRRRRSSMSMRISSIRQVGGVNSIDNFARSLQRAAGFRDIGAARRGSFVLADDDTGEDSESEGAQAPGRHTSLLRQQIEAAGQQSPSDDAIDEGPEEGPKGDFLTREDARPTGVQKSSDFNDRLSTAPYLASSLGQDYGTSFGTISSQPTDAARRRASILVQARQEAATLQEPDKEREPLLTRKVTLQDGTHTTVIVGQSTVPQTVFNSVNTLIGVGLLSLPLGIRYAGWVIGMIFLFLAAVVTQYTAKLLAYCLDVDRSLVNYSDVAFISVGNKARTVVQALFSIELTAANVALVVLFADSLNALIPGLQIWEWKVLCGIILIPLNFVPLRLLAVTSVLGILCCVGLVAIVFIDGLIKPHSPGSLRQPARTYAFPEHWSTLPLSFGLLMSPWGGHSVFPNIYRDMRHPMKYGKALNYTYVSVYSLLAAMSLGGYLMFGEQVRDEITSNILLTEGYPRTLSILIVIFIAVIPLTKVPLR
jgi:solute carrier family 32 (vesicular inhibitory amino acid transporter)